ncbi:MAG: cytochrome c [Nitrosomonas sp.]|jgi:cytochrome c553|nr:cytochrome c [Nitrosomonas sp.]
MKYKIMMNLLLATSLFLVFSGAVYAEGDAAAAKEKNSMCVGCHGIEDWRTAFPVVYHVPKIGGQNEQYLIDALTQYKNGERSHPSMKAIAASLSEQDIKDFAAYYSGNAGN